MINFFDKTMWPFQKNEHVSMRELGDTVKEATNRSIVEHQKLTNDWNKKNKTEEGMKKYDERLENYRDAKKRIELRLSGEVQTALDKFKKELRL